MTNGAQYLQSTLEQTQALTKIWMDSMSQMTDAAFTFRPGAPTPEMARHARDSFLSAMDNSAENFMRSEPFLQAIGQSLNWAMDMRKQFTQMMTQIQHSAGAPAHEDIRALVMGMRHFEERLGSRLDRMDDLLESLAQRILEMETPTPEHDDPEGEPGSHVRPVAESLSSQRKQKSGRPNKGRRH